MTTKRGKEIENAVRVLERLLDAVKEPETDADLQMFVKFWTAYAICKADHTAREKEKS
jgi:CRISPR/Cas system CSM-associated protein Csm2 small subunit